MRQQGVKWNVGADGAGVSEVMAGCNGGLTAVLEDQVGLVVGGEVVSTLRESRAFTFGDAEAEHCVACRDGEQVRAMTQRFLEAK
jgi:hypothetical protein